MAQISRQPLRRDIEDRMIEVFLGTIATLQDPKEIEDFFNDLLSPIERTMLAKRLTIAVLLGKGYTYPMIAEVLKVTPTTIASVSIQFRYAGKGYKNIVEKIILEKSQEDFWEKVEDTLALSMTRKSKKTKEKKRRKFF